MYTGGSKHQHGTVLLSLYRKQNMKQLVEIDNFGIAFSAKLDAILSDFNWIAINKPWKSLLITNFFLQALNSKMWDKHYILTKILLLNDYLTNSNMKVTFLWVPNHSKISGNRIADNLTKDVFRSVVQCSSNDVQIKRA